MLELGVSHELTYLLLSDVEQGRRRVGQGKGRPGSALEPAGGPYRAALASGCGEFLLEIPELPILGKWAD